MSSSNQLVCIKNPEPGLNAVFENMYLNERLVDVTLSCCDGQLQAHKLVLAACSPYFSSLFDKLANPFHYPVIVIKDMNIDDLRLVIDFMYKGQLTVSQEKLASLVKSAENLQINGLTNSGSTIVTNNNNVDNNNKNVMTNGSHRNNSGMQKLKKEKKKPTPALNFNRNYHTNHHTRHHDGFIPNADKLLEQSMITGDTLDGNHNQFSCNNDPTSTKNLNINHQQLMHTPSGLHVAQHHQLTANDPQQHNFANQFMGQVLSHSINTNRSTSSSAQASNHSDQANSQVGTHRGRVHPCNICWKTFREKANLKRHLQVHSLDRVIYACPDCNKTFAWKDNYIRHTKTAHHMNNSRPQT